MRKALQFFSQNTVDCYNISLNGFFILFYWEKRYSFPHKTLSIATTFFLMGFFASKIIFVGFFFLILSWQRIQLCNFFFFLLNEKLNHVAKALYLFLQNTVDCYSFCSVSKFLITNTTFFFVMKYLLHRTFNFYYLFSAGSQL